VPEAPGSTPDGVRKTVLPNGLRILSETIPQFSSVTLGIWVEAGSRYECPDQNGISHFLEHLFFKGTERRTALQIAQEIDAVGGVLNAFTDREYTCYHAKVLREDLPLAFDVLSDVFLHAQFPVDEVERERTVILSEIAEGEDSPDHYIHILFDLGFWPGDALARPIAGTAATVSQLTREDFTRFVAERYRPDRVVIAAAGAIEHDWLVDQVAREFGALSGTAARPTFGSPRPDLSLRMHAKELEQVQMLVGIPGLPKTDPRRYAAFVLNTILGDGMSSRLFQEIREKRGLAYSVSSFLVSFHKAGYLAVYAGLGAESVREALDVVREQLRTLREKGLTDEELKRAKSQIKGSMLLSLESSGSRMSRMAINDIYYGRQITPAEVAQSISAVTHDDVRAVARELFDLDRMAVTLLGDVDGHGIDESAALLG
jgi:predicted Zn-dependent peptidase